MPFVSKFSRGKIKPEELNRIVSDLRGIQNGLQEIRVKSATVMTDAKVHGNADIEGAITNSGTPVDNRTVADARYALKNGSMEVNFTANTMTMNAGILAAIQKLVISTPNLVDVCLYDTTQDSDGGAWRERCQHTSWFNEPLNTSTRGKSAKFPALALIVATTTAVTIYDATDPTLPMWMVFNGNGGGTGDGMLAANGPYPHTSVAAINGRVYTGSTVYGYAFVDFVADRGMRYGNTSANRTHGGGIASRNTSASGFSDSTSNLIVNSAVNDVTATILPGAPIDPATGLPVPSVGISTAGGASVINHDGTVSSYSSGAWGTAGTKSVTAAGSRFLFSADFNSVGQQLVYASGAFAATSNSGFRLNDNFRYRLQGMGRRLAAGVYQGSAQRLEIMLPNWEEPYKSMVALTAIDYASGILPGDIRRAWLANSPTADRSVKNKPLTMVGSLTATPVAPGAELLGYSGFSASNYLEEPYSADLDFGTGDFVFMGWVKPTSTVSRRSLFRRGNWNGALFSGGLIDLDIQAGGAVRFQVSSNGLASSDSITATSSLSAGVPAFVVTLVRSGKLELWINGVKAAPDVAITAATTGVSNTGATLRVGAHQSDNYPLTDAAIALFRFSAYAPTADQIRAIYEAEKHLFVENAKALLGGTSSTVQALAHDPDTDQLYVGTSDGVSVFQDLRRVNYLKGDPLTSANIKTIGAARGAVLIGTGAEASYTAPELILREATPPNLRDGSADLNVREVTEGGVKLGDKYLAKQAVQTGSFNAVFKGFTADVTVLVTWTKISDVVTISLPMVNGASNAEHMYLAGTSIPAALRPAAAEVLVPVVVATPSYEAGFISVSNSGNWGVGRFGGVFSTSGSKGMPPTCFTYKL